MIFEETPHGSMCVGLLPTASILRILAVLSMAQCERVRHPFFHHEENAPGGDMQLLSHRILFEAILLTHIDEAVLANDEFQNYVSTST